MRTTRLFLLAGIAVSAALFAARIAMADSPDEFSDELNHGFNRNLYWPEPYQSADIAAVSAPFAVMIQKGWQEENMLGSHHFADGTSEPTGAGQQKIRWIVTQAPLKYRTIYVERANTPEETAARIAATRKVAQRFLFDGEVANVQESTGVSHGWSADYIGKIHDTYQSSIQPPVLPKIGPALDLSNK